LSSDIIFNLFELQPKLKYYLEVVGEDLTEANRIALEVEEGIIQDLIRAEESGLKRGPMP
jgi:hypothetical protein